MADETPDPSPLSRVQFAQVCHALRALLKDKYHTTSEGLSAEGEAFIKLDRIRFRAEINDTEVLVKLVIRSYEGALADGFVLAWRPTEGSQPPEEASFFDLWTWAQGQNDILFIPFDVKILTLAHGADDRLASFYRWVDPSGRLKPQQADYVQFIIGMVEGADGHMAFVPAQAWNTATEQSSGIESVVHGYPLWIPMSMVADQHLGTAIERIVEVALQGAGWYKNPTTSTVLKGWPVSTVSTARMGPGVGVGNVRSFAAVRAFWEEVQALNGRVHFNPFAPLIIDFVIWLPELGYLWVEHKSRQIPLETISYRDDRQFPFALRRMWHVFYCAAADGALCITRNHVQYTWAGNSRLPRAVVARHRVRNLAEALPYLRENAEAARAEVAQAVSDLRPADISEGLDTKASTKRLQEAPLRGREDDPVAGLLIRKRGAPGVSSMLNRFARTTGQAVCLALGGGHPLGTHAIVAHDWSADDTYNFDHHGTLPIDFTSGGIASRTFVPLLMQDNTMPSNIRAAKGLPIAIRKHHWRLTVEAPKPLIIGMLVADEVFARDPAPRNSWYLCLPAGFTSKHTGGHYRQPAAVEDATGAHLFPTVALDKDLIPEPPWGTLNKVVQPFIAKYLLDKEINLARYVLNLHDGTIYRQIIKVLESTGMTRITNPAFEKSLNREFDAREYHGTVGELLDDTWGYGMTRQPTTTTS